MADKGLKVVIDDLKTLADNFDREGRDYAGLADKVQPKIPADSGDTELDGIINDLLSHLGTLHHDMAQSIHGHGQLIDHARKAYENQEIDNRKLFDDLDPNQAKNSELWNNPT